ncbi:hypothetical protein RWA06_04710 [Sinorhizobium meliloti]|uniref:hypothetical protein n=1 Tax=Rhizobium meliloti TaxID=382 RepID=UPI00299CFE7E|nr:hypothetical protein [Sinorhizobium meliloti]
MSQPDRIWARLDPATVYMDGSSPLVARTREFPGAEEYILADAARYMLEALKAINEAGILNPTGSKSVDHATQKMHAAIAKAEGRA